MSILLFHNSLELLDGRSAYFVLRRVSLALDDHQAVRMDGKAIDTKVVRFLSSPSLKASPMKEAHAVLLKIKGVHAKQVLSERHLPPAWRNGWGPSAALSSQPSSAR